MEPAFAGEDSAQTPGGNNDHLKMIHQKFSATRISPCDLQFEREDRSILSAFVHNDRAWLLYRRNDNDAGFSTRDPDYNGPDDAMLAYIIGNGQEDEYPVSWTIPIDEAIRAVEYFILTGDKAPWLTWHDDQ